MNNNLQKVVLIAVVIAVVIGGILFLGRKPKPANPSGVNQNQASSVPSVDFVLGTVTKVAGSTIDFTANGQARSAAISSSTTILKQVQQGSGYTNLAAKVSDLNVGERIAIYSKSMSGEPLQPYRILILAPSIK